MPSSQYKACVRVEQVLQVRPSCYMNPNSHFRQSPDLSLKMHLKAVRIIKPTDLTVKSNLWSAKERAGRFWF